MLGTFASVEKRVIGQGTCVAYKTYSKSHGRLVFLHYKRELWALKELAVFTIKDSVQNHIVQLMDNQESANSYHLIFPYYKETLAMTMSSSAKSPQLAHHFLQQISQGLHYMHQRGIVHCDLTPSNILIDDSTGCMFICDFGCAHSDAGSGRDSESLADEEIGTRYYKAPEHLFGSKVYKPATDVWSLGTIFSEILIGYPIFNGESDIEQIGRFVFRLGKPSLQVQTEEMTHYPDANKLIFFDDNDSDVEDFSDDEDENGCASIRMSLAAILEQENVPQIDRKVITSILTWSIKERLTIPHLNNLLQS
ncbi:CMGC/CDK protein kinase [Mucor circinelloides 1006PhL]|uniref:CMGC/CDK protein kinase n=1 Tax=Mucor circinelloides f. circinelloides (strain 1006PhL) TaxID=1220926 RepID=S2JVT8_MUCC1|nr:CMGC/CDK protein kinase [Mucor circinelloides 1006PhL]